MNEITITIDIECHTDDQIKLDVSANGAISLVENEITKLYEHPEFGTLIQDITVDVD